MERSMLASKLRKNFYRSPFMGGITVGDIVNLYSQTGVFQGINTYRNPGEISVLIPLR